MHMWHKALDDRKSIRALFVDKAFDYVNHSTILRKMAALDIHPCILEWMHSFLLDCQQQVKIGNHYSDWITLTGGMPQETWFGPYVFFILIDGLKTIMATFKFVFLNSLKPRFRGFEIWAGYPSFRVPGYSGCIPWCTRQL